MSPTARRSAWFRARPAARPGTATRWRRRSPGSATVRRGYTWWTSTRRSGAVPTPGCSARGPNLDVQREVCAHSDAPVIASGGVSTLDDLRALKSLEQHGVEGVIAGKALYAGAFTVAEALAVLAS